MSILSDDHETFLDQVNEDVRDQADILVHKELRQPENLERWILALKQMKRGTESQLVANKAARHERRLTSDTDNYLTWLAKQNRWRADVLRVKSGIENKLGEANMLRDSALNKLCEAIVRHRENILSAPDDFDTSVYDEELWAALRD
jgi:hypothetical protein